MNKFAKIVRAKTNGASRNSLAFQTCAVEMVEMALTNGLTGWARVVALQNLPRKVAVVKLNTILKIK